MTERHHAPGAEERLSEEAEKAARIVREDAAAAEAVAEREVREAECRAKEGLVEGVSSARQPQGGRPPSRGRAAHAPGGAARGRGRRRGPRDGQGGAPRR